MMSLLRSIVTLAFLSMLGAVPAAAQAPQIYVISGLEDYTPYTKHILELTWKGKEVSGWLKPLLGDKTPPIAVRGDNYEDGKLNLVIVTSPSQRINFVKSTKGGTIRWETPSSSDKSVMFSRPIAGDWSEAALTLAEHECGPMYGMVGVEFGPTTMGEVERKLPKELLDLKVSEYGADPAKRMAMSFREVIRGELNSPKDADTTDRIPAQGMAVPVGSELYIVKTLRASGLVKSANLGAGGCGGADRSYFVVKRSLFFADGNFSRDKFVGFVDAALPQILGTDDKNRKWETRIAEPVIKTVSVPPFTTAYRMKVYAASQVTRRENGFWDRFQLTLEPNENVDNGKDEYAVVVTVERLKTAKQTTARIPYDDWFSKDLEETAEASITTAIARGFTALSGGWCAVEREGTMLCDRRAEGTR